MKKLPSHLVPCLLVASYLVTSCGSPGAQLASTSSPPPIIEASQPSVSPQPSPQPQTEPPTTEPSQAPPTPTTVPPATPTKFAGPATVTLWYGYRSGSMEETALVALLDPLKKEFPGYSIRLVRVEFGSLFSKYRTEVTKGGGPDLFVAPNDQIGDDARKGFVEDITALANGRLGGYTPEGLQGLTVGENLYGVPESFKAVVLWYNKKLMLEPPSTTDKLLELMEGGTRMAITNGCYYHYGFFASFGGRIFDSQWQFVADEGGVSQAMAYLSDLYQISTSHHWPMSETAGYGPFANGEVVAITNGNWAMGDYRRALGKYLAVAPLPAGPGGPAAPLLGVDGYYINPNSPNKEAALEVALFLTNKESQTVMMNKGGHVPTRLDVEVIDPLILDLLEAFKTAYVRPTVPQMDNYWKFFCSTDDVFKNGVSPAQWVNIANQQANQ